MREILNTGFMKMQQYWCWAPDEVEKDRGVRVEGLSSQDAAEKYADQSYPQFDYPSTLVVNVERCGADFYRSYDVRVETDPVFTATERKE